MYGFFILISVACFFFSV